MVRKMAYIGSFWLIGLFAASFLYFSVNFAVSSFLVISAAALIAIYRKRYVRYAVCMISAALAMFLYGTYDILVYRNVIKYDGCYAEVKGVITGYAEHSGDKSSYTIKGVINDDVRATVICYADSVSADVGDNIKIIGKADILSDSYTFPAETYYRSKGIFLRINNVSEINYTEDHGFSLIKLSDRYRKHIISVINSAMDIRESSLMAAMLFGDKSDMESSEKTLMYRAGIGHIMAVSGVHLAVVCSFFGYIIDLLPVNKYVKFCIKLIPVLCFSLLAGMSVSVIRSAVMVIIVQAAGLFRRQADTFSSLGTAVILLTVSGPFAVRDPSFLLSVSGVFGAGVMAPSVIKYIEEKHKAGPLLRSVIVPLCVNAAIFPAAIMYFDEFSVISPITNLLLLPVCEIILICGVIVTVTGGIGIIAVPVLWLCGVLCDIVIKVSELVGNINFLYIPLGNDIVKAAVITGAAVVVSAFIISRKSGITGIAAVCIFMLTVFCVNIYRIIPDDKIAVSVLRKDNAYSIVVHDRKSAVIADIKGGGKTAPDIVKYLERNGIYRINAVIMNDSANTAVPVYKEKLRLFDTASFFMPEEYSAFADTGIDGTVYKENSELGFSEYSICLGDNDEITLKYGDISIVFYPYRTENDQGYAAEIIYSENSFSADKETAAGQKIHIDDNLRFSIDPSGSVSCGTVG